MAKKAAAKKPRIKVVEDEELEQAAISDAKKDLAESAAEIQELKGEQENKSTSFPFGANEMAKTATKKTATNKKKTAKPAAEISGSEKVRQYYAKHPEAKQSEIAKACEVNPSQVSSVLKALGAKPKKAKGKGRPAKAVPSTNGNGHGAAEFVKAAFGLGLDKAIETLQTIKKAIG